MNRIQEVFSAPRVLLPVIHPIGWEEARKAIRLSNEAGVKGVFLINQRMNQRDVLLLVKETRGSYPNLWVGVNLLGLDPIYALREAVKVEAQGVWSDNAGIDEYETSQTNPRNMLYGRNELGWKGLYFGGVAFKYQRPVNPDKYGVAAKAAVPYMDVICTSGPGTGEEADLGKVKAMREGVGPYAALALASGVTPENVETYLPYVDAFLVGTGIEKSFGVLDMDKIQALQTKITNYPNTKGSPTHGT